MSNSRMRRNSKTAWCLKILCSAVLLMETSSQHQHQHSNIQLSGNLSTSVTTVHVQIASLIYDKSKQTYVAVPLVSTSTSTPKSTRKPNFNKTTTTTSTTTTTPVSTTPQTRVIIDVPALRKECEDQGFLFDDQGICREVWRMLPPVVIPTNETENSSSADIGVTERPGQMTTEVNFDNSTSVNNERHRHGTSGVNIERSDNSESNVERPGLTTGRPGLGEGDRRPTQEPIRNTCPLGQIMTAQGQCQRLKIIRN